MLLTNFSAVLLGRLDLDPTLKWEINLDHGTVFCHSLRVMSILRSLGLVGHFILFGKDSYKRTYRTMGLKHIDTGHCICLHAV